MSLTIRQANAQDAEVLSLLGATTFYDTFHAFHNEEDMKKYIADAYNIEKISTNLTDPGILYYLALRSGLPVGYIKLIKNVQPPELPEGRVAELEKIYVLKEYLGTGIGKKLMQQAIVAMVQENFDWLFLGVWQQNQRALAFYAGFGWEICGIRQFKLGNTICDDYVMKLKLG
jgi:ribosomal protein S18 acetylase RimI-like enzyme